MQDQASDYTPAAIKQCCQELMKFGLIESQAKAKLYQTALVHHQQINHLFEPFDLGIKLDDQRGLAYLVVTNADLENESPDEWTHPLVRKQRLTLEQSLLLAILRKHFLQHESENAIGSDATLAVAELLPEIRVYLGDLGSDIQENKRLRQLLEQLKGHGVVSEIDKNEQITIRPFIAHLANPENLQSLLNQYQQLKSP